MTRQIAQKIAGNMVREFSEERRFTLSLPTRAHLELFAESFSKDYGCAVVWNRDANRIAVRCPQEAVVEFGEVAS